MKKVHPFTNKVCIAGYFDPIHEGHLDLITNAKKLGHLIVIAGTEEQCDKKHGSHFHSWEGKVRLLTKLGADEVSPNIDTDGRCVETLRHIKPNIFAVGDYTKVPEEEVCREIGCTILYNVGKRLNRSSKFFG
jgi:cytidyltransferase-like protein